MSSIIMIRRIRAVSKEKVSGQRVGEFAERISENWRNTVESIMKVAADCATAKENFTRSEKLELLELLPFGETMFSKLASIGGDRRLKEHQKLLPPSISTMYLIQNMSDEKLEAAVMEGVLRPDVTRKAFEDWTRVKDVRPVRSTPSLELPLALYCLYSEKLLRAEQHVQVENAVISLADGQGMKAAIFTGESLLAQLKAFFGERPKTT
jgi:hypothetical protein